MINPDNDSADEKEKEDGVTHHYFEEDISNNVPSALRYLSLIYLCLSVLSIIIMKNEAKSYTDDAEASEICPSIKAGLSTFTFKLLFVCLYCSTAAGYYIIGAYKNFGQETIHDDQFLTVVGSIGSVFNGCFRYAWAHAMEMYNFKIVYLILCGIQVVTMSTLYFVADVEALFFIWICAINCTEGGNFSLFPSILTKLYGKKRGAELYGVLFLCLAFSSITGFLLELYLLKYVGYLAMFLALAFLTGISFVLILVKFKEIPPLLNSDLTKFVPTNIQKESTSF